MPGISELPEDEAKERLYRAYMRAHQRYTEDPENTEGQHPSLDLKRWRAVGAQATDEGGLGPVEIQKRGASDDVQPTKSAGGNGGNGGAEPAMDGVLTFDEMNGAAKFVTSTGKVLTGDAALLAHARLVDPRKVKRMASAIKGYERK